MLIRLIFFFLVAFAFEVNAKTDAPWRQVTNCRLLPNQWNDGDSFHVEVNGTEKILRLYYVDCPELESLYPSRIASQAKYFGVSHARLFELGREARDYSNVLLRSRPFTIWTRGEDAGGASKLKRTFALIEVEGKDLGELLVQRGLARVYGKSTSMPDGRSLKSEWKKLHAIENEARRQKVGAWK